MKPYQAVGYTMLQTSAITAIVSQRVYHGLRPEGTVVPAINYYEVGGGIRVHGIEATSFSINCRASTAGAARNLARLVLNLFTGSSGTGIYGSMNGFDISRASLNNDNGLIPEPDNGIFNAPVDVTIVYPISTVS